MDTNFDISSSAAHRIAHLLATEPPGSRLRVEVLGGGCSGFQYRFDFDASSPADDDVLYEKEGAQVVVDPSSLELLKGSLLDYIEELGGAAFEIRNPNAKSSCGCGNSFSIG